MRRSLPNCEGPKLKPFKSKAATPQPSFLKLLGSGTHGYVFKAQLDGIIYAIKLFKFAHVTNNLPKTALYAPDNIRTVEYHLDPFYAECRAFGRLHETRHEDLAVKCYGYFMLESTAEDDISRDFDITEWDRKDEDRDKPICAIVKEYIDFSLYYTPSMIPRMMQNLLDLNSLGIEVADIKSDAYVRGTLVDFSLARTVPHFMMDVGPDNDQRSKIGEGASGDFDAFDTNIIEEWNDNPANKQKKPIELRFTPNPDYCDRLRHRPRAGYIERHTPIAMLYDWRKHPSLPPERRRKTNGFLTRGTRLYERDWMIAKRMNKAAKLREEAKSRNTA